MGRGLAMAAALVALAAVAGVSLASHAFVGTWGSRGAGNGQFDQARGVAVDASGAVYVADTLNHRVQKFAADGTFVTVWGSAGSANGQFQSPYDVAVDGAGNVYVADRNNNRIQKFGPDGSFILAFGSVGNGSGQLAAPTGIAVGAAGDVYVADRNNHRVQRFNADGAFLGQWGGFGTGPGQFNLPVDLAADGAGNLYVSDSRNQRIQKFNADGAFLTAFGQRGSGPGQFNFGDNGFVATDAAGNVYVSDFGNHRVQVLDPAGAFVEAFGARGTGPGQFAFPTGVALGPDGSTYVAENYRMQRFGPRPAAAPAPEVGRTVVAQAVSGRVLVRVPGSRRFVPLGATSEIPVRSIVDAGKGRVRMTSASNTRGGVQRADFYNGTFQVRQRRGARPITEIVLKGGSFRACRRKGARAAQRGSRRVRRVWGNGRGRFRTRGRYSSAAVRGTVWLTEDRCDGTLTRVRRGRVTVRDFRLRRNRTLRAGQSYLARAR